MGEKEGREFLFERMNAATLLFYSANQTNAARRSLFESLFEDLCRIFADIRKGYVHIQLHKCPGKETAVHNRTTNDKCPDACVCTSSNYKEHRGIDTTTTTKLNPLLHTSYV